MGSLFSRNLLMGVGSKQRYHLLPDMGRNSIDLFEDILSKKAVRVSGQDTIFVNKACGIYVTLVTEITLLFKPVRIRPPQPISGMYVI